MNSINFVKEAQQYLKVLTPTVLDCGCGDGRVVLSMDNCQITAFDCDVTKVAELQMKINKLQKQQVIKIFQENILNFSFKKENFLGWDLIICTNVLHYISDYSASKTIEKMAKALRQDGVIAFSYVMDRKGLPATIIGTLIENFETLEIECKKIYDPGHEGEPEPHSHMIFYFIGRKKLV